MNKNDRNYTKIRGVIGFILIMISLLYGRLMANEVYPFVDRMIAIFLMLVGVIVGIILSSKYLDSLFNK